MLTLNISGSPVSPNVSENAALSCRISCVVLDALDSFAAHPQYNVIMRPWAFCLNDTFDTFAIKFRQTANG